MKVTFECKIRKSDKPVDSHSWHGTKFKFCRSHNHRRRQSMSGPWELDTGTDSQSSLPSVLSIGVL